MRSLKDRLHELHKSDKSPAAPAPEAPAAGESTVSTREKLAMLVEREMRRKGQATPRPEAAKPPREESFVVREYSYSLQARFGLLSLDGWAKAVPEHLAVLSGERAFLPIDPRRLVYIDTETTGLAGGTGTMPFMVGCGFFREDSFVVTIFVMKNPAREAEFIAALDEFLQANDFAGSVTFNGKGFDFPLLEARYILCRRRFSLSARPHLDFLFPARTIWKNTYESRRLGYLGEMLLGMSRDGDIPGSEIPMLYFQYLRNGDFSLLEPVIEHNALDIVGLCAVVLLAVQYLEDHSRTRDIGEILGLAMLQERYGNLQQAADLYRVVQECGLREDVVMQAFKRQGWLMKRNKLYDEARAMWSVLADGQDMEALRELCIHYEHREKNYHLALAAVQRGLEELDASDAQRQDLEKRLQRLQRKISRLERQDKE